MDINSKLFFLVEKKKQERAKELELKNNPEVVEEEISEGIKAVRIMAEAKKEEPIEVIRDLSDEEVLARMAAEEEPSIIDKIKDALITRNAEATAPAIEAEAPEAGSTETVIISQSDSKITKQIDSNKTYNVTFQTSSGVITYIVNSSKSQQITLNWVKDGNEEQLVVNGDRVEVKVPNNEYCSVIIGGNQNKILVDGTTKSYESTGSISFKSYKGGSAVARWGGETPTPTPEPEPPIPANAQQISLSRNSAVEMELGKSKLPGSNTTSEAITADKPLLLTLTNPFTGSNYKYIISLKDGATTAQKPTFKFYDNGRLYIKGSNLKIVAFDGQEDDLILYGAGNEVYTGDLDDYVRIGYASTQGLAYTSSSNNKIFTGSGDDYVTSYGKNTIDMGAGNGKDYVKYWYTCTITNADKKHSAYTAYASEQDSIDGWGRQSGAGDCQFFSYINSLAGYGNKDNVNIKEKLNIDIVKNNDDSYTVTFGNYNGTGTNTVTIPKKSTKVTKTVNDSLGNSHTVTIKDPEGWSDSGSAWGDLDTVLIDIAMRTLADKNQNASCQYRFVAVYKKDSDGKYIVDSNGKKIVDHYDLDTGVTLNDLAKKYWPQYLLGTTKYLTLSASESKTQLEKYWELYKNGKIDNLSIGMYSDKTAIGIAGMHQYRILEFDVENDLLVVQNPWDDRDVTRIPYSKYKSNLWYLQVLGYTATECNAKYKELHPEAANNEIELNNDFEEEEYMYNDEFEYMPLEDEANPFMNENLIVFDEVNETETSINRLKSTLFRKRNELTN